MPECSGRPGESVLIGVVTGTPDAARVVPLKAPMEVTPEVLALSGPVSPSEVFRFASTCRAEACTHLQADAVNSPTARLRRCRRSRSN